MTRDEIPEEYIPLTIKALEHYYAYTVATQREQSKYQEAADWFKSAERKGAAKEDAPEKPKRKRA